MKWSLGSSVLGPIARVGEAFTTLRPVQAMIQQSGLRMYMMGHRQMRAVTDIWLTKCSTTGHKAVFRL